MVGRLPLINVATSLIFMRGLRGSARSLKALHALKLIILIENVRFAFEALTLLGIMRIVDAAMLAVL